MSDSDNLESESEQLAKKGKSHYDTLPSYLVKNIKKRERQKRYRERNREELKQREAERRKRIQSSQSIAGPSTSSNPNTIELNNEEIITAISHSSSDLEKTQQSSTQRNKQGTEMNALQNKRERQRRYREKNRDKLKQREAERRRLLQNAESILELYTSPNIENREIITEPIIIIDEVSTILGM